MLSTEEQTRLWYILLGFDSEKRKSIESLPIERRKKLLADITTLIENASAEGQECNIKISSDFYEKYNDVIQYLTVNASHC